MKMTIVIGLAMLALFAYQACPFLTPSAPARSFTQAANDAQYYAQADCPHHRRAVCKNAAGRLAAGLGHGRWRAQEELWECRVWDFCAYSGDYTASSSHQCRNFRILTDGQRDQIGRWWNC